MLSPLYFVSRCIAIILIAVFCTRLQAERIVLVAGGAVERAGVPATEAALKDPFGIGFDAKDNLFIIEMVAPLRLLKVDTKGMLTHVAGQSTPGDIADGPAMQARFSGPHNLSVLPDGDVLISDTWHALVRRMHVKAGKISTMPGFHVPPEQGRTGGPYCVTANFAGTEAYIADLKRIHAVDLKTGRSRVVAGNGQKGIPPDGALAAESPLFDPRAVAIDRKGNVYILERSGHALRVVGRDGKIRTVVNASGKKGATGDGGDALQATMNGPKHLCVDRDDNVVIADAENNLIRKYIPATGKIIHVAGTGKKGAAGVGGSPKDCELARPHGVAVHRDGTLFIADTYNNRVLKIVK